MTKLQNLLKGIIRENPVLVLVLGTCPTLAISTSVIDAFGMGIAATIVLICSSRTMESFIKYSKPNRTCVGNLLFPRRLVIGATTTVGLCLFPILF